MIHLEQTHEWVLLRPRSSLHNERRYNWLSTHKFELSFLPFPFLSFEAMLNDCSHRLIRLFSSFNALLIDCSYGLLQCWTIIFVVSHIVPIVSSNVERSFSSFNAMLNDCSYGLMQCWTIVLFVCHIVPIVWCNVEQSFLFVILFLSFEAMLNVRSHCLMRCWTTVPMVWSYVERPFLSFVMLFLSFDAITNVSRKKHWHTGYIITIDPPLCVVSTCTKPKSCKVVPKKTDIIFLQRAGCYATIFVDDGQLPGRLEFWFGFWGGRPDWWDEILLICGNKTLTVSIQVVFFRLFSSIAALAHVCTCGLCKPNLLST